MRQKIGQSPPEYKNIVHYVKERGFNMLPTSTLPDIAQIVHAKRMMTSRDKALAKPSLDALKELIRKKTGIDSTTWKTPTWQNT